MQMLTSSEKVYLGTDLLDVLFFSSHPLYPPSMLLKSWREIPFPFHTEITITKA